MPIGLMSDIDIDPATGLPRRKTPAVGLLSERPAPVALQPRYEQAPNPEIISPEIIPYEAETQARDWQNNPQTGLMGLSTQEPQQAPPAPIVAQQQPIQTLPVQPVEQPISQNQELPDTSAEFAGTPTDLSVGAGLKRGLATGAGALLSMAKSVASLETRAASIGIDAINGIRSYLGAPPQNNDTLLRIQKDIDERTNLLGQNTYIEDYAKAENKKIFNAALQSGGIPLATASGLADEMIRTGTSMAAQLALLGTGAGMGAIPEGASIGRAWLQLAKSMMPEAGKFAALTYMTTPGTAAERA
jgi:hypothetical protein